MRIDAFASAWRYLSVVPIIVLAISLAIVLVPEDEQRELTQAEKAQFDAMGPMAVVRTYFACGDPAVERYLRPPSSTVMAITGGWGKRWKSDAENEGGIDRLQVKGGRRVSNYTADGYTEIRMFTVQYSTRRENEGFPPGVRYYFAWTGRDMGTSGWKLLSYGTGP